MAEGLLADLLEQLRPWLALLAVEPFTLGSELDRAWQLVPAHLHEPLLAASPASLWSLEAFHAPGPLGDVSSRLARSSCPRAPRHAAATVDGPAATGMSVKKRHEVAALLAELTARVPRPCAVLDVGAGEGHLAAALAVLGGYPRVVGLDGAATERPSLANRLRQMRSARGPDAPAHDPSFAQLVVSDTTRPAHARLAAGLDERDPVALVGLHCCGQLADNVARLFAEDPRCAWLMVVGCCYGRTGVVEEQCSWHFPKSAWLRAHASGCNFSLAFFKCATESPELWKRCPDPVAWLRETLWRLVAHALLTELQPEVRVGSGRVRGSCFAAYFRGVHARSTAASDPCPWDDEALEALFASREALLAPRLRALLCLRVVLAEAVESFVGT